MKLTDITSALTSFSIINPPENNLAINRVVYDSRKVLPGDVFVAIKGLEIDGHKYIFDAINKGAICAIGEKQKLDQLKIWDIRCKA